MTKIISGTADEALRPRAYGRRSSLKLLWTALRPHQWVKNTFLLTPLIFGQKLNDPGAVWSASLAFVTFCLMASAIYIVNDCHDAAEDREHPEKRHRPITSGAIPMSVALITAATLIILALGLTAFINSRFTIISIAYCVLMLGYCVSLKRLMIVDCMVIASGFVLRVVGGAAAIGVYPSHWLIVCAFLLALFLAFTKRRQELLMLTSGAASHRHVLGKYTVGYLEQVNNILIGATIVCYALYTVSPETISKFGTDRMIYGTVFVVYGMMRYMALTMDPANGGNPSKMLLRDKPILASVCGWGIYNAAVINQETVRQWAAKFFSH